MRSRSLGVATAALLPAGLVGWVVGGNHSDCEYSCPARGRCPIPADCRGHTFNWTAGVAAGVLVVLFVVWLSWLLSRHSAGHRDETY